MALGKKVKPQKHYKAKQSNFNEGANSPVFLSGVLKLGVPFLHTCCLRTRKLCQTKYGKSEASLILRFHVKMGYFLRRFNFLLFRLTRFVMLILDGNVQITRAE